MLADMLAGILAEMLIPDHAGSVLQLRFTFGNSLCQALLQPESPPWEHARR